MLSFNSLSVVDGAVQATSGMGLRRDERLVVTYQHGFRGLSDHDLRDRCRSMLRGGAGEPQRAVRAGAVARLLRRLLRRVSDAELHDLAVAVEAFSRAPADLADGCELFPGQVQAAIGLMQNYVIQMDTGEGKTYALLPAAFALACQYRNVYIVCANDYLARRDATRTRRFWDFVGLIPESGPITATPASGPVGSSTLPCPTC